MEYVKKYEYMLERQEIMEFCLHAWAESAKCRKWVWFRLMLILVLECILLPRVAVWIIVLIAAVLLISIVVSCVSIGKSITGCKWTLWVENGILKVDLSLLTLSEPPRPDPVLDGRFLLEKKN